MKKVIIFFLLICLSESIQAQDHLKQIDSLQKALGTTEAEYEKFEIRFELFNHTRRSNPDSALPYAQQNLLAARKMKSDSLLAIAYTQFKILSTITGNYPQALQYAFESLHAAERTKNFLRIADAYDGLGDVYIDQADFKRGVFYSNKAMSILYEHVPFTFSLNKNSDTGFVYVNELIDLSRAYEENNQLDSALKYVQLVEQWTGKEVPRAFDPIQSIYGAIYSKKGEYPKAIQYYQSNGDYLGLANTFKKMNQPDSAIYNANKILSDENSLKFPLTQMNTFTLLASAYKSKHDIDSAAKYFELALATKDTLFNQDKAVQLQNLTFNEQVRQQELQEVEQKRLYRYRFIALLVGLGVLGIIAFLLYRNNQHKQKAFTQLQKQKKETDQQRYKAEQTLEELKAAQLQLIQSEKMASLGELTAGIAHEIQNPLNFVNNFSEVNTELIAEMKEEIDKGNLNGIKMIANDLEENEQKINHHGKRADAIVKGMLQHSKSHTGQKEPIDINVLADEYLRLTYHGLRGKNNTFNVELKTDFDKTIGKINIVPQDIGRVFLNLYNNAFYAVKEKNTATQPQSELSSAGQKYEPAVSVSTKKINDKIEVRVKDNGNGIPQKVLDKIFQPFFTTKPTGQGTGLGLSLAYDIIKAHGGDLKAETKEGEGSEFIIQIPINA